jgi:hypothetical protein
LWSSSTVASNSVERVSRIDQWLRDASQAGIRRRVAQVGQRSSDVHETRSIHPMLGFKRFETATITITYIELVEKMRLS